MQSGSDMVPGWNPVKGFDGGWRDSCVRQMWDWNTSADLKTNGSPGDGGLRTSVWVDLGARPRPPWGPGRHGRLPRVRRTFTRARQGFTVLYADQNQRGYEAFLRVIAEGRIPGSDVTVPKVEH